MEKARSAKPALNTTPNHAPPADVTGPMHAAGPLATSYDEIPYPRLAFPYTHPSHLATVGRLLGLLPAPVDRCRVLELGCASGANLVPMAYAVPGSTFVGIDLSERQIADARALADALGLSNLALEQLDIREAAESLAARFGPFDYIIAHGIYSWVPNAVKDALLTACRRLLAPEGIAYVSYNCYPGCQLREMIRRMCQYHGRRESAPRRFLASNRAFLASLLEILPANDDPYRAVLREQAASLLAERDAVILHDDLERDNDPQLLHQFLAAASSHGLQYLGDAHFGQMFGVGIDSAGLDLIRQGGDTTDFQQYLDFLYGRALRTTLLCREEVVVRHHLAPDAVRDLWIASSAVPITPDGEKMSLDRIEQAGLDSGEPLVFRCDECTTSIASPLGKTAMIELSLEYPKPLAFDALVERVRKRLGSSGAGMDPPAAMQLAPILVEWFAMRLIDLRAFEAPIAGEASARPIASAVARHQVANDWGAADVATPPSADGPMYQVTNLIHRRVNLGGELAAQVLRRLDGRSDRASIVEALAQPVLSGEAGMRVEGRLMTDAAIVRELLGQRVDTCIADFARNALLIREVGGG